MTDNIQKKNMGMERSALSGFHEVHGYFFAKDFLAEAETRQRVLALWEDGSKLYKLDIGYVLVQPNASFQEVEKTTGTALIKQGHYLSNRLKKAASPPLSRTQSTSQLRLLHRGEWHQTALDKLNQYDPARWLEAGDYQSFILEAHALAIPKTPKQVTFGEKTSTSEIVDKEGLKPSNELTQVMEDLKQQTKAAKASKSSQSEGSTGYGVPNAGLSLLDHLRAGFSRLMMRSPLGDAIGKSQAKFVEDTLKQFQDGNIDDALKRAVPLGSMKDALSGVNHPFTGRFMPRSDLSISRQNSQGSQSVCLDEQVLDMLKHTYQRAFEQLDADGRIEEAAFVLVDLLQEIDQAISYLEKNKKFLMAAQIAEGHQVEPARVIRQWILAGNWQRAIQIARMSNRYEEAITLLSGSHKTEADQLRWMLAEMHYESGNLETAVAIGWPVLEKQAEVVKWLKQSVALGGTLAVSHLLKLALHDPDGEHEHLPALQQLFQDDTSTSAALRLQLINELNQYSVNPLAKSLASLAVRPYLRDVAKGRIDHNNKRWLRLINLSNDQVLHADLFRVNIDESNTKQLLRDQDNPVQYQLAACFGRNISDCQRLADGSLLIAFAHAGLEHRSPQGELLSSYPDICHEIVMSDQGYQALLVAIHDGFQVINVFDLAKRSVSYWLQTKMTAWTDNYDGLSWIVASQDQVWVLDLQQSSIVSLWSVGDLKGDVTVIRRSPDYFSFLVEGETQYERWRYRLPDLFLKERTPWGQKALPIISAHISSSGKLVHASDDSSSFGLYSTDNADLLRVNEGTIRQLWAFPEWIVVSCESDESNHLSVYAYEDASDMTPQLEITYPKGENLQCHCDDLFLVLYSDAGRVMVIELDYGAVVAEITV